MLSIGRLSLARADYYLDSVGRGADDYYNEAGEAPGRWVGTASEMLRLSGEVEGDDFRAILEGQDPETQTPLLASHNRKVSGFDLTFRAPKSVSIVFGIADPALQAEVIAAHEHAVGVALGWLEAEAVFTRRGRNGWRIMAGQGFVGAAFRHRSSRAGDPHLHTHVVVANATVDWDSRWSTLDSKCLYRSAKTAGYIYELELRHALTARLGVAWDPTINGIADLTAIPVPLRDEFSTRAREIREFMAGRGQSSPAAAEHAALATRQAKDHKVDGRALRADWLDRAAALGYPRFELIAALNRDYPERAPVYPTEVFTYLASSDGLTKHDSTFDRHDLIRGLCEFVSAAVDLDRVESVANDFLAQHHIIPVGQATRHEHPRYTTRELLDIEHDAVAYAAKTLRPVDTRLVQTGRSAIRRTPALSDEQADMIRALASSEHAIEIVVAAAGTGKTFTLNAMSEAWSTAGYQPVGCSLSARAARELQDSAEIPSTSVARFIHNLQTNKAKLTRRSVIVVDEAAMVGTRTLAQIFAHAKHAEARVVLVGDPRQLIEIEAGGLFAAIARERMPIGLTVNRRQREPWERVALDELRDGNIHKAIGAYLQHGRIHHGTGTYELMITDWWHSFNNGDTALMLASTRESVRWLNQTARSWMRNGMVLDGPELRTPNGALQAGDRVMLQKTNDKLGLANGTLATVTSVDVVLGTIEIDDQRGQKQHLPAEYLDAGHVGYGYAATIHKTQGTTIDQAFVWVTPELQRESAYSALSRGRQQNHLYLDHDHGIDLHAASNTVPGAAESEQHLPTPEAQAPIAALTQQLEPQHEKQLGRDFGLGM